MGWDLTFFGSEIVCKWEITSVKGSLSHPYKRKITLIGLKLEDLQKTTMGWKVEMREKSLCEYINACPRSKSSHGAVESPRSGESRPSLGHVQGQSIEPSLLRPHIPDTSATLTPFPIPDLPISMPLLFAQSSLSPAMPLSLEGRLYERHPFFKTKFEYYLLSSCSVAPNHFGLTSLVTMIMVSLLDYRLFPCLLFPWN